MTGSGRRRSLTAALAGLPLAARITLLVAVVVDLALIGANLVFHLFDEPEREPFHPVWSDLRWNGDNDGSWMELAGQLQLVVAVGCFVVIARRTRQALYGVLAGLLAWIAIDDVARVHEHGGELAVAMDVESWMGIPAQQLGELAVWAVAGLVLVGALALTFPRASVQARKDAAVVLAIFALLLFFAAGIDTLRPVIFDVASSWLETGLSLSESAGELVTLTLMLGAALLVLHREAMASEPEGVGSAAQVAR